MVLDAARTLDAFATSGAVDPAAFGSVVGSALKAAGDATRHVVAFGEMVQLLWDRGALAAAVDLEVLWNELSLVSNFSLHCGYRVPEPALHEELVQALAELHTSIVTSPSHVVAHFEPSLEAPRASWRFVARVLAEWEITGHLDAANVVVSELAANACLHARTRFSVHVERGEGRLRLTVEDESPRLPAIDRLQRRSLGGRGLVLVEAFARAWGVEPRDGGGKAVWAELPA